MSDFGAIRSKLCRAPASSQVSLKKELLLPHILHCNFSHWCKHKRKLSSLKGWWGSVWSITMFSVLFCSTPSLTHTHTNCIAHRICSHTAAALHFSVTPTLRRVKARKPRKNSLRTPTAPSLLTQQPPPPWAQVCLHVWRIGGRRHLILHMHILPDTQPQPPNYTHTCSYTDGAELSPRHASPPMYKPHAAPARRARVQARRQDVKMETDGDSEGERQRENWRVQDVLTLVFVFIKRVWLRGFRGAPGGKFNTAVPLNYYHLHVRNVNRNRCFSVGVSWFLVLLKYKNECDVKKISFPVCISLKM